MCVCDSVLLNYTNIRHWIYLLKNKNKSIKQYNVSYKWFNSLSNIDNDKLINIFNCQHVTVKIIIINIGNYNNKYWNIKCNLYNIIK